VIHFIRAVLLGSAFVGSAIGHVMAETLITPSEAALPTISESGLSMRGITRGPLIKQIMPSPDTVGSKAPLEFKIEITPRNNEALDKESVKVLYLKVPTVDLTTRLHPYLTEEGIDMKMADIPVGTHLLRVDAKDSRGRGSTAILKLTITEK
jgi:hypothetical protein